MIYDDDNKKRLESIIYNDIIMKCDVDIRKDLECNILMAGMNTMYDDLRSKLLKKLISLPLYTTWKVVVNERNAE